MNPMNKLFDASVKDEAINMLAQIMMDIAPSFVNAYMAEGYEYEAANTALECMNDCIEELSGGGHA